MSVLIICANCTEQGITGNGYYNPTPTHGADHCIACGLKMGDDDVRSVFNTYVIPDVPKVYQDNAAVLKIELKAFKARYIKLQAELDEVKEDRNNLFEQLRNVDMILKSKGSSLEHFLKSNSEEEKEVKTGFGLVEID